jgi:hypothetical protein
MVVIVVMLLGVERAAFPQRPRVKTRPTKASKETPAARDQTRQRPQVQIFRRRISSRAAETLGDLPKPSCKL